MFVSLVLRRVAGSAIAVLLLTAGALLAVPAIASASPYPPTEQCTLSTTAGPVRAGQDVELHGSGFAPHADVDVSVGSSALGTVTTDADGSFTDSFPIPSGVTGAVRIVADSAGTSCSLTASETQQPAQANNNAAAPAGPGSTASTGFATVAASVVAIVLLGGGLAFLMLGRRRHHS